MMNVLGVKPHGPFARRGQNHGSRWDAVIGGGRHPWRAGLRDVRPTGIAARDDARRSQDLVVASDNGHVVSRELAIELTGRDERIRFPTAAIVDRDLRIPLREIVGAALPALAAKDGGRAGLPGKGDVDSMPRAHWRGG